MKINFIKSKENKLMPIVDCKSITIPKDIPVQYPDNLHYIEDVIKCTVSSSSQENEGTIMTVTVRVAEKLDYPDSDSKLN